MDERDLTNNKFIDTNVYNVKDNPEKYEKEVAEFEKFMGFKNIDLGNINFTTSSNKLNNLVESSENISDLVDSKNVLLNDSGMLNNMLSKQDFLRQNSTLFDSQNNKDDTSLSLKLQSKQAGPQDRFVQERKRYLSIDSRDREITLFPDQNSYKIDLGKEIYTNVISIKLKSSEFINTQQLIRETPVSQKNNVIQWQINESGGLTTYTTSLIPGNYNEEGLSAEIERAMNSIVRSTGTLNNFTVTIDSITDIVEFTSITFTTISDPFTLEIPIGATATTTEVTITDIEHSALPGLGNYFTVGNRIYIENAVSFGGIPASALNGEHVIVEVPDQNSYKILVNGVATANETGGGSSVRIGSGVPFSLLFSQPNSPAEVLGFQLIDTPFAVTTQNVKEIFSYTDPNTRLIINNILPGPSTNTSLVRTTLPHLLTTGERIFIFNSSTTPSGVSPYTHEYGVGVLNPADQDIRDLFVAAITDPAGLSITVIDSNTFTLPVPYGDYITDAPGSPSISDYINSNVDDDDENGNIVLREINAAIDFGGEKYIYMTSEKIGGDFSTSEQGIENVFAKIQLASQASQTVFNSYIGGIKNYYESPLSELTEIDFEFRTHLGDLFEFNDRNHSFTLEITEAIQKLEGSGYNARIGART